MFSPLRTDMVHDDRAAPLLTICHDSRVGLCVRALDDCDAGTILDRFDGMVSPHLSQHSLQVKPGMHISATRYIGYLAHGCEPNCRLDMDAFHLVTLRSVRAEEVLTIDYAATEDRLYAQFACACGASACRGWITGRTDPINVAGQRHLAALSADAMPA